MQIPTRYDSREELIMDMNILGKILQVPSKTIEELTKSLKAEYRLKHPLPSLEQKRYEISEIVSDNYAITGEEELVLGENEILVDLSADDDTLEIDVSSISVTEESKVFFKYEHQVTPSIMEEFLNGDTHRYDGNVVSLQEVEADDRFVLDDEQIEMMSATTETWGSGGLDIDLSTEDTVEPEYIIEVDGEEIEPNLEFDIDSDITEDIHVEPEFEEPVHEEIEIDDLPYSDGEPGGIVTDGDYDWNRGFGFEDYVESVIEETSDFDEEEYEDEEESDLDDYDEEESDLVEAYDFDSEEDDSEDEYLESDEENDFDSEDDEYLESDEDEEYLESDEDKEYLEPDEEYSEFDEGEEYLESDEDEEEEDFEDEEYLEDDYEDEDYEEDEDSIEDDSDSEEEYFESEDIDIGEYVGEDLEPQSDTEGQAVVESDDDLGFIEFDEEDLGFEEDTSIAMNSAHVVKAQPVSKPIDKNDKSDIKKKELSSGKLSTDDDFVVSILNNPALSSEQKTQLLETYYKSSKTTTKSDFGEMPVTNEPPKPVKKEKEEETYKDIRDFVRKHPRCKVSEVLEHYSRQELNNEICKGRLIRRGDIIHRV